MLNIPLESAQLSIVVKHMQICGAGVPSHLDQTLRGFTEVFNVLIAELKVCNSLHYSIILIDDIDKLVCAW